MPDRVFEVVRMQPYVQAAWSKTPCPLAAECRNPATHFVRYRGAKGKVMRVIACDEHARLEAEKAGMKIGEMSSR